MKTQKLTKVQQAVMDKIKAGYKLCSFHTNRMSGNVLFWVHVTEEGEIIADDKALYPQLRQLFWKNLITEKDFVDPRNFDYEENYTSEMRYCGIVPIH